MSGKKSTRNPDIDSDLETINLDKHPEGYARIGAYINSDDNSALHRRFGDLHARALLYKEVELTDLEVKLANLDKTDSEKPDTKWRNNFSIHTDDGQGNEIRRDLMKKIVQKLQEYDDLLLRDRNVRLLRRPSPRTLSNFRHYIHLSNQIGREDQRYIKYANDFVSVEEYEESWLDDRLHRFMGHCKKGILRYIFVSRADQAKTENPYIHYYSESRLGVFIKVIIAVVSIALLMIPVYVFLSVKLSTKVMASITLLFTFLFAAAVSVFTSARRQDVFGYTAAYCAVLVVFIGNIQQQQRNF